MQRAGFNMRLLRFGLLLVVALERLPEPRRSSIAARMNRQLLQRCGGHGGELMDNANAEALRAALVVFSDGPQEVLPAQGEEWLEYWWTVLTPHLGAETHDSGATSSTSTAGVRPSPTLRESSGRSGDGNLGSAGHGDTELNVVDRALQEERDMEEAKRRSGEEARPEQVRAEQDSDLAQIVEENTAFTFEELRQLRLSGEEMARKKQEAAEARMAKWVEVEEEREKTQALLSQKGSNNRRNS